jgi:hypothetical protein
MYIYEATFKCLVHRRNEELSTNIDEGEVKFWPEPANRQFVVRLHTIVVRSNSTIQNFDGSSYFPVLLMHEIYGVIVPWEPISLQRIHGCIEVTYSIIPNHGPRMLYHHHHSSNSYKSNVI